MCLLYPFVFLFTVSPLLTPPPPALRLIEMAGLFNLEKTMVWVLHKELEYKLEKLKYKKF